MTVRELRKLLTFVENQQLTVKELRAILFEAEEQDKEITPHQIFELTK